MKRFDWKWFFRGWFVRPEVSALESFLLRLAFALIVAFTLRLPVEFTVEPHPVGLLRILHHIDPNRTWLTWLADPATFDTYRAVIYLLLGLYVAGVALPVVLPVVAVMHVLPFTLFDSQGYPHHGNQIVSMLLLVQACCAVVNSIRKRKLDLALPDPVLRGWLQWQSVTILTGSYFLSVITKLQVSKGLWLLHSNHFALDMIKTQRQSWLNRLSPEFANIPESALWMLQHPWTARIVFSGGIILEAVCILGIGNRLLAFLIGASLIIMHRSIDALMGGVAFPYNELLDLTFLVGVPFGIAWTLEKFLSRRVAWGVVLGGLAGIPLSWAVQSPSRHIPDLGSYLQATLNYLGVWGSDKWGEFLAFIWPEMTGICLLTALVGALIARWMPTRNLPAATIA